MKLEPETLFIGVIDLFSVILHGVVVTCIVKDEALGQMSRTGFSETKAKAAKLRYE